MGFFDAIVAIPRGMLAAGLAGGGAHGGSREVVMVPGWLRGRLTGLPPRDQKSGRKNVQPRPAGAFCWGDFCSTSGFRVSYLGRYGLVALRGLGSGC